jgi:hypothetical protein
MPYCDGNEMNEIAEKDESELPKAALLSLRKLWLTHLPTKLLTKDKI